MGNMILTMQMSLDGVVSEVEQWMSLSDEILEDMLTYYDTVDTVMVGGATYASMADYWQHAEKASESALERSIAKKINAIDKIVISRSKPDLVWRNSRAIVASDDEALLREMERLKSSAKGNISIESGLRTWRFFIRHSLFDDLWLFLHPVVAARGDRLFEGAPDRIPLEASSSKQYRNGVIGLYCRRG